MNLGADGIERILPPCSCRIRLELLLWRAVLVVLVGAVVEVEDVDDGQGVAVLGTVENHANLVEDDVDVELGLLVCHRPVDDEARLASNRLENVLMLDLVGQHRLESLNGSLLVVDASVEGARIGVEVKRQCAELGELVNVLDVVLEERLDPVLVS